MNVRMSCGGIHMTRIAAGCALASLLGFSGPAHAGSWRNINPGAGGAFTCVAAGATGIVLVGSDIGGLYRSEDDGLTWDNVGSLNGGLQKCYVASIGFDTIDGAIVHVGTDGGLYRSTNGGRTFNSKVDGGYWSAIAVAPTNYNVVYAVRHSSFSSTDPQIYRSLNRGADWTYLSSLPAGTRVIKLGVKPKEPWKLFALSGYEKLVGSAQPRRALYVSDGGIVWTDAHGDSTGQGMTGNPWDAAYDPIHPDTIFATSVLGAGNVDDASSWSGYTWRGRQTGGVWTQVSAHTGAVVVRPGTGQVLTIDVRRDGPGCTECGAFKSVDFGNTWTHISTMAGWDPGWNGSIAWAYNGSYSGVAKTLGQDLSNWGAIYWVTPQFVWKSPDFGYSFTSVFTDQVAPGYWRGRGINNVAPAAVSVSGSALYAGYYDLGIWRSFDAGSSWQSSNDAGLTGGWAGKGGNCMTILADPARSNVVWASQGESMTSASLIRSTTSGSPGGWSVGAGVPAGFVTGLALDPASSSSSRTLYASSNGDLYKSVDDGANWGMVFDCDSCYVSAASGSRVFAGGPKGLWRSLDGGSTWSPLAAATFRLGPNAYGLNSAKWNGPHDIQILGDTVYVAVWGNHRGLYRSVDVGNSWTRLRDDNYALEIERDENGILYLGSSSATNSGGTGSSGSSGVLYSLDSGATWWSLNDGLPWAFAWPIETMSLGGGSVRVFVGAPGSGLWTTLVTGGIPVAVGEQNALGLRLSGFLPNPARERIAVGFSLPSAEPAALEVFDLMGRRLLRRDVGGMGPGSHVLPLGSEFRPPPGVYAIRLVQGARSVRTRAVVVR